ncbi:TetR/AcrR family transcriptional regulator [Amycolatopsis vastitatis]|uniref:TetR family transcriptional regulator n=1 Tax=Amycolatopsis vastitatis TaxID=1905142 RepID=A0A229SZD2_9PSEU|nr:TetR/AcrR family transcriptional regulator [Amycolatopsis vastitatis]OXM64100.1 TetR family transcriptional regulator [Amycolatopsis vastitatis]
MDQSSERDRLVDAAYRTLVSTGGASLSVNDVLQAAELSTRAFYRHFASKDELLLALFRQDSDQVAARLRRAAAADSPAAALRAFVQAMLRITADPRRRQRVLVMSSEEIARAKGFTAERQRYHALVQGELVALLERGRADGTFPLAQPSSDAGWIRAAIQHAFDEQISGSGAVTPNETAELLTGFALRALGARDAETAGG